MKRIVIMLTVALCLSGRAQAQRCLPGQKGIQFTAGTVNGVNIRKGFHGSIAYSVYTKNANRRVFSVEYLEKRYPYKDLNLSQSQFTAEAGYYLNFLSDGGKTFFLSLGVSAMAGYELINRNKKLLFDGATINNKDSFLYGGALTLEAEIFMTDRVVLLINAREKLLKGSSVGKFNTQFGIGIKYIIN
jgi:hypothetical protein